MSNRQHDLGARRILVGTAAVLALGLASATTAAAHPSGHGDGHGDGRPAPVMTKPATGPSTFLTAELSGTQEVPVPGGPAVADPNGAATALVELRGDRVTFALRWSGVSQLSLGHIHQGKAGGNGPVKVGLFTTPMPDTVTAAAGQVTLTDAALTRDIRTNPEGFYVNLHSTEFPGGAVRGQLKLAKKRINVLSILRGGKIRALANGAQEVQPADGKAFKDPDGFAVAFLGPKAGAVDYSMAWVNIQAPTLGHIHQERFGKNGAVKLNLFSNPVPAGIVAVSGTAANVDPALLNDLRRDPTGFYVNLHTAEFPGGAVRGQLFG